MNMIKITKKWPITACLSLCLFNLPLIAEGKEEKKNELLLTQNNVLSPSKVKQILINLDSKKNSKKQKKSRNKNLTIPPGPPGPPGPQGPTGPMGQQGANFCFSQDEAGQLTFEVSLFQAGVSHLKLLHATPYVVYPSGKVITGKSVTINFADIAADSFIDLFSSSFGGAPIKISSPEYGVYQIGVQLLAQTPIQREFNLNLAASVTALRGETLLTTFTEIIPSGLQTILRNQSTEIQMHVAYFYGPFESTIP